MIALYKMCKGKSRKKSLKLLKGSPTRSNVFLAWLGLAGVIATIVFKSFS
jgi:hypothetical protein